MNYSVRTINENYKKTAAFQHCSLYNSFARSVSEGKNISLLGRALQPGVHSFVSISRFRRNDKKRISAMALANSANNRHIFPLVYSRARCRFF